MMLSLHPMNLLPGDGIHLVEEVGELRSSGALAFIVTSTGTLGKIFI